MSYCIPQSREEKLGKNLTVGKRFQTGGMQAFGGIANIPMVSNHQSFSLNLYPTKLRQFMLISEQNMTSTLHSHRSHIF